MRTLHLLVAIGLTSMLVACGDKDNDDPCDAGGSSGKLALTGSTDTWTTGANPSAALPFSGDATASSDSGCAKTKASGSVAGGAMPTASEDAASSGKTSGDMEDDMAMPSIDGGSGGAGDGQVSWGILTAGTFDDALNPLHFTKYWDEPLAANPYSEDPTQLQWPKAADLPTGERFGGVAKTALDLSFVVDVTGSMGDELAYITKELDHIVGAVKGKYPDVAQRWSLIVYRDDGDEYVTKGINFTGNLEEFRQFLAAQSAGGGGDLPEAMHTALVEADTRLQWGDANTAKVLFLIADAPPHVQYVDETLAALQKIAAKGAHIYPVASSGVDPLAERVMRYGAVLSKGEYIFLTDDSGVGGSHMEPHVPCYHARKLADVMIDTLVAEIQDARVNPDPATILRTVGSPVDGVCQPQDQ